MNSNVSSLKLFGITALALGLGLGGGFVIGERFIGGPEKGTFQSASGSRGLITSTSSYAPAVKNAQSAVVNVFSEKKVNRMSPLDLFFGDGGDEPFFLPPQSRMQKSLGSGVLISNDGYILTNSHVVSGADVINVALSDGKELKAKLVGIDTKTDLALLKLSGSNFPAVVFGNSDQIEIGDVVLAIGNPFGIGQAVTIGIISAKKRENLGILDYEDFIQTDAAINPGNSGGALIDSKGNLIGINTAIYSKSGGYQGIGFAVPSNLAKKIAEELKSKGKVSRPFMGVAVIGLNEQMNSVTAYFLERGYEKGALIVKVEPNGPADRAGMKPASLITKINGKEIKVPEQLFKIVSETPEGETLEVEASVLDTNTGKISKEQYSIKPGVS